MKIKLIVLTALMLAFASNVSAQIADFTSVDVFLNIATDMMNGKRITDEQWTRLDSSAAYKEYSTRPDQVRINIIKTSMKLSFAESDAAQTDSILGISEEEMRNSSEAWLMNHTLSNYLYTKENLESIKSFRQEYDFDALIEKSKENLCAFLGLPSLDPSVTFHPLYFLFQEGDAQVRDNGIYIDFSSFYKKTSKQKIDYLTHEFFHNYREGFEDHDFNYKNNLNYCLDVIQNEGIADLTDKKNGYKDFFTKEGAKPEEIETWVNLYNNAPKDLKKLQKLVLKYAKNKILEETLDEKIWDIVKMNGHPIGLYMANRIVEGGYEDEMLKTFYNPYEFYVLYNKAAKQQHGFQLSDKFMDYLKNLIGEYYH